MTPGGRFASMPLFTKNPVTGKVGMLRRQCTHEYKIEPSTSYVRDWLVARDHAKRITDKHGRTSRRVNRKVYIEDWYGISFDEFERAGRNRGAAWQRAVYPLIERRMRRADCVRWLVEHKLPVPRKSSCIVCPFHDAAYWADLHDHYPTLWDMVCQFDDWLRTPAGAQAVARKRRQSLYVHPACVPLREVDFRTHTPPVELCGDHCRT
jgi:hypothetical protein